MSKIFDPCIDRYPALFTWLDARGGRHLWTSPGRNGSPSVQGWRVGPAVVVVLLYQDFKAAGEPRGWGLATEPDTNNIQLTFAEIEKRLGIAGPPSDPPAADV